MCLGHGGGDGYKTLAAAEQFINTPHVAESLRTKAVVLPGDTVTGTWAPALAQYGLASEVLQLLRGSSILGALASRFRHTPFHAKIPREIGSGTGGAWIGEGLSTPVAATASTP